MSLHIGFISSFDSLLILCIQILIYFNIFSFRSFRFHAFSSDVSQFKIRSA